MRRLLILTGLAVVGAALATADSYTGQLLDASCYAHAKSAKTCAATPSSSEFLLEASGKLYKLDPDGNAKAVEALKSHEPATPGTEAGPVNAKVNGSMEGDILHVDTIDLQ